MDRIGQTPPSQMFAAEHDALGRERGSTARSTAAADAAAAAAGVDLAAASVLLPADWRAFRRRRTRR